MRFILLAGVAMLVVGPLVWVVVALVRSERRKAAEAGHPSLGAYLRAAPLTDKEKGDAADLFLKGLVICMLGLVFPPLLLIGLVPFFFGARKLVYASMGLGLVDDAEPPQPQPPPQGA